MLMLPGGVTADEHSDPTVVDSDPDFKPVKVTTPTKAGLSAAQRIPVFMEVVGTATVRPVGQRKGLGGVHHPRAALLVPLDWPAARIHRLRVS